MSRKAKNKKVAEDRAALLWERYHQNGGRITCAEVFELAGIHSSNLDITFQAHGVKGPTVWDSHKAIRERQINDLWSKSRELGRDWLTVLEVAKVVKIKTKDVSRFRKRLAGKIPEIRGERRREPDFQDISGMVRVDVGRPYTLKWYKAEPGPGPDQTTFYIL